MSKPTHSKPKPTDVIQAKATRRANAKVSRKAVHQQPLMLRHLWRWVAEFGTIEIGYCYQTRSFIRVLDEGGLIWQGQSAYGGLEAALADAEAGVSRRMKELGIEETD